VIVVHLFGNVAPVAEIEAFGVPVVEDAAQAAGTITRDGTRPGALGAISTFSFYPSKNLGGFGDGGMVCTSDAGLAERVRMLRFHGSFDKVTYEHIGYNSRLDELQAAVLRVQLPHLDGWADHRRHAAARYAEQLQGVVGLPVATDGAKPAWHVHALRAPDADGLIAGLREHGVESRAYYRVPLHLQPVFARPELALPGTAVAAREHLAIPISAAITDEQVDAVCEAVRACVPGST
jgi:dTDP-4-amino-4,6-dideoxygalactose transaminase